MADNDMNDSGTSEPDGGPIPDQTPQEPDGDAPALTTPMAKTAEALRLLGAGKKYGECS